MDEPVRGVGISTRYSALCKDCRRKQAKASPFEYGAEWLESVVARGGTASDRCPNCRKTHKQLIKAVAVPYVDVETVQPVADRENPTGPLGGLGPLPPAHRRRDLTVDLQEFKLGLTDEHVVTLLRELTNKRAAIVVAGTGSGKSTFLPYRLLYPPPGSPRLVENGTIVVTEPRIEATRQTATTVARLYCKSEPGPGGPIGFQTGEHGREFIGEDNRLVFVTDGTLQNWIVQGRLGEFSAIIIDEAHELNANIEFLVAYLAANLDRFPKLRVIVASATIDPQPFVDLFGGPDNAYVLSVDNQGKDFGYGEPLWPGSNVDPEGHPDWRRDWEGWGDLRDLTAQLAGLRTEAAAVDPEDAFEKGRLARVVSDQVRAILDGTHAGEILAFLPGKKDIDAVVNLVQPHLPPNARVYGYHREATESVKKAVAAEGRPGRRRVIVATNIAETSLTIPGLRYVIDTGLIRQKTWDVTNAVAELPVVPHSQFGIRQRWGRVGRKEPGWVFPIYSKEWFESRVLSTPPGAARDNLEGVVLNAAAAGVSDLSRLRFLSSDQRVAGEHSATFEAETVRARRVLTARGALDEGVLTRLGRELQNGLGTADARTAIALADGVSCAVEVATAFAALGGQALDRGLFANRIEWTSEEKRSAARRLAMLTDGARDDLEVVVRAWWAAETSGDFDRWFARLWADSTALTKALKERVKWLSGLSAAIRRSAGDLRVVSPALIDRARAAVFAALPDLLLRRSGRNWVDTADRTIVVGRNVPASVNEIVCLHVSYFSQTWRGIGVVIPPAWALECRDPTELLVAVARRDQLGRPTDADLEWAAMLDMAPIGAVVAVARASDDPAIAAVLAEPPARPGFDEDDELDDQSERPSDVIPELGEEVDLLSDANDLPTVASIAMRQQPPTPLSAILEHPARWVGEDRERGRVVRYERRPGGALRPVVRAVLGREGEPVAWGAFRALLAERWGTAKREMFEFVATGDDRVVHIPFGELTLSKKLGSVGDWLRPEVEVPLTALPIDVTWTASLRPALAEAYQRLPETNGQCADGSLVKGRAATIVGNAPDGGKRVELDGSTVPIEYFISDEHLRMAGSSKATGTRLVVTSANTQTATVASPVLPSATVPVSADLSVDYTAGTISVVGTMPLSTRDELLALVPESAGWASAVRTLWLASIPTTMNRVAAAGPPVSALTVGETYAGRVSVGGPDSVTVDVNGERVHVSRADIGSGVLHAAKSLSVGSDVDVEIIDHPRSGTYGRLPGIATLPLRDQLAATVGGSLVNAVVNRDDCSYLQVTLPAGIRASIVISGATGPSTDYPVGSTQQVRVTRASFVSPKNRPEIRVLRVNVEPVRAAPKGPGGSGRSALSQGVWPARIVAVDVAAVLVEFEGGAHRRVNWRDIGDQGLLYPQRHFAAGTATQVEVGRPFTRDGQQRNDLKLVVPTDDLAMQAATAFPVGSRHDAAVTNLAGSRAFVALWPEGKLSGSYVIGPGRAVPTVGTKIAVVVDKPPRIRNGKLLIDVRRVG